MYLTKLVLEWPARCEAGNEAVNAKQVQDVSLI